MDWILSDLLKEMEYLSGWNDYYNSQPDFKTAWSNLQRGDWAIRIAVKLGIDESLLRYVGALQVDTVLHITEDKRIIEFINFVIKSRGVGIFDKYSAHYSIIKQALKEANDDYWNFESWTSNESSYMSVSMKGMDAVSSYIHDKAHSTDLASNRGRAEAFSEGITPCLRMKGFELGASAKYSVAKAAFHLLGDIFRASNCSKLEDVPLELKRATSCYGDSYSTTYKESYIKFSFDWYMESGTGVFPTYLAESKAYSDAELVTEQTVNKYQLKMVNICKEHLTKSVFEKMGIM